MREGTRRMGERGGELGLVRRRRRKMLDDRKGEGIRQRWAKEGMVRRVGGDLTCCPVCERREREKGHISMVISALGREREKTDTSRGRTVWHVVRTCRRA